MGRPARAVAAQSTRRNSSSTEYSRSWSNSVPPPRPCAERRPTSRMRALRMRSSASSFDRNGGYTRSTPGTTHRGLAGAEAERAVDPHDELGERRTGRGGPGGSRSRRCSVAAPGDRGRPPAGCRPAATAPARRRAPRARPGAGGCAPSTPISAAAPEGHRAGQRALDGQRAGRRREERVDERHERQGAVDRDQLDQDAPAGHDEQRHRRQRRDRRQPARRDQPPAAHRAAARR